MENENNTNVDVTVAVSPNLGSGGGQGGEIGANPVVGLGSHEQPVYTHPASTVYYRVSPLAPHVAYQPHGAPY